MRLITYPAIVAFLVIGLVSPSEADAQCRRGVIVGPGITVVGPCLPPPIFVVRPLPPPVVVVQPLPPPPPPAAAPPPPPPSPQATVVAPVVPCYAPPARVYRPRYRRVRLFTVGMYGEGTMFSKGGMGGAGLYAQLKVGRGLHLYGSVGGSSSCTSCDPDNYRRSDLKTSLGLQYYMSRRNWRIKPFIRGSIVYQAVNFRDPMSFDNDSILKESQVGGELALGLEWRPLSWLVFGADVAYLGLSRVGNDEFVTQQVVLDQNRMDGVPTVNKNEHGVNFRFTAAIRF